MYWPKRVQEWHITIYITTCIIYKYFSRVSYIFVFLTKNDAFSLCVKMKPSFFVWKINVSRFELKMRCSLFEKICGHIEPVRMFTAHGNYTRSSIINHLCSRNTYLRYHMTSYFLRKMKRVYLEKDGIIWYLKNVHVKSVMKFDSWRFWEIYP